MQIYFFLLKGGEEYGRIPIHGLTFPMTTTTANSLISFEMEG